jgi:osmotically-inducible protein OsmY
VNAKLFDDNIMRGASISVDTFEGNVILTGAVENEKQIEHATAIVKKCLWGAEGKKSHYDQKIIRSRPQKSSARPARDFPPKTRFELSSIFFLGWREGI